MTVLDRVPVRAITVRAQAAELGKVASAWLRTCLVAAAGLLFLVGWLPAKVLRVLWFAAVWVVAAVVEGAVAGWREGGDG